jgi:4-hydroxy-3-polyprenylbenzoate decarboxylase
MDLAFPLVVGISGATGAIYGIEALKVLKGLGYETHLIISHVAEQIIEFETDYTVDEVRALADLVYAVDDLAAPVASGSFLTRGMLVAPCTIKTLSAIANSYTDNLLSRTADVTLKEGRPLVLMVRETPFHKGHLLRMKRAADLGAVILPPLPAFYIKPKTILDLVHQSIGKALDCFGIEHQLYRRWGTR